MGKKSEGDGKRASFAERVKNRRHDLSITQEGLRARIDTALKAADYISRETLRNMEGGGSAEYRLPSRLSGKGISPIEAVALGLSVPLGYLLRGFSDEALKASCFWTRIASGKIALYDELDGAQSSFADFLAGLPSTEAELFGLPLHIYRNERAFAVIFRVEKIYSGLEMLVVNEPPLLFWDEEDVDLWVGNMELNELDEGAFRVEFQAYRTYFRGLIQARKKKYRVVLNRATFCKWLKRKSQASRREQLDLIARYLKCPNFEMVFLKPEEQGSYRTNAISEKEVISKHSAISESLDDTIAVQISQTPPDHRPIEYFLTPLRLRGYLLQEEKSQIDLARARAIEQMERELERDLTTESEIAEASLQVINKVRREVDAA